MRFWKTAGRRWLFLIPMAYAQTAAPNNEDFNFKARWKWYAKRTYTDPWRHIRLLGEVTVDDYLSGELDKWGSGLSGVGKSIAPVYGQRVISNTTEFLAGALIFHDDARYRDSQKSGFFSRGLYASLGAFTARNKRGKTRPAYSRIIAVTAGILIANRWRPAPAGGMDLADRLVFGITDKVQDNLLQEFTPELKRFGLRLWHKVRPPKIKSGVRSPHFGFFYLLWLFQEFLKYGIDTVGDYLVAGVVGVNGIGHVFAVAE